MINFIQRAITRALVLATITLISTKIRFRLILAMLTFLGGQFATVIPVAHALNTTGGAATSWGSTWGGTSWSVENFRGTNDVTYDVCLVESDGVTCQKDAATNDKTINIPAPKFDITEKPNGKYEVFYKGIVEVTHAYSDVSPVDGRAWAEIVLHWPEVDMEITSTNEYTDGDVTITKENRKYFLKLKDGNNLLDNNGKLSGTKKIVPYLYHDGEYSICNGSSTDPLCETKITYGTVPFDPLVIFPSLFNASGDEVTGDYGLDITQVCFKTSYADAGIVNPDRLDIQSKNDDVFYSCEGLSIVARACADYDGEDNCNDTNGITNDVGEHYTFVLNGAFGYNLKTPPMMICIGTDVTDWFKVEDTIGQEVIITPCDPNQGWIPLPYKVTSTEVWFTSSEGGNKEISGVNIIGFYSPVPIPNIEEPDRTVSLYDWSDFEVMKNITFTSTANLTDYLIGTDLSENPDVFKGGNGDDFIAGGLGSDCLAGEQNNDNLWGGRMPSEILTGETPTDEPTRDESDDVFVFDNKLGKDVIWDFSQADNDLIAILSSTVPTITCSDGNPPAVDQSCPDSTYQVTLKGQNYVIVHVLDGVLSTDLDGVLSTDNVVNYESLAALKSDASQCNGL